MITNFKSYNNLKIENIKVGEYVLLTFKMLRFLNNNGFYSFLENNIGKVVNIGYDKVLTIKYENIPDVIKNNFQDEFFNGDCVRMNIKYVYKHSFNIEDIIISKTADKYNL